MNRPRGIYSLAPGAFDAIYGHPERAQISQLLTIEEVAVIPSDLWNHPALTETEVIISGWGGPQLTHQLLDAAPRLRALFYGAGSVAGIATPASWKRGIVICSAYSANAAPVAEYTLATILFSLKHGWQLSREYRETRRPPRYTGPGAYGTKVGLISLGVIARHLIRLLKPFDLRIVAYDPFCSEKEAAALGITLASLDEIFRTCPVVSLHTPWLAETEGMITGKHIASMLPGATFINTSRGAVVNEVEMIKALTDRPDLQAILDVTHPEPPAPESPLFTLPNVILTPHSAGSMGSECRRMGQLMCDELARFLAGDPLHSQITETLANSSSHRPIYVTPVQP
jgi:phosphoglycerate dehydrogenase-like enzyme